MGRKSRAHEAKTAPKVDPAKPQPTEADWADAINTIKIHGDFDRAVFREEMEKLARELESEGHRAHRNADWLEGLSYREEWNRVDRELTRQGYRPQPGEDRTPEEKRLLDRVMNQYMPSAARARSARWGVSEHSRTAIMSRLERKKYDERHFRLVKPQLDRLIDENLYKRDRSLRKTAAVLLDASEIIDDELKTISDFIKAHRKHQETTDGRNPLRALRTLLAFMDKWDLDSTTAAERLAKDEIHYEPETLKTDLWRYRTGQMGPK